jgi:NhaP-type Na+/H+ or K+/H+ antiporter
VYAVLSLTVVRMVPVAIAMMGTRARGPTVAFLGWFGPRGLASIVFGVVVIDAADLPHTAVLTVAIAVTVAMSVVAHGLSAAPLTSRYATWCAAAADRGRAPMESVSAPAQRSRFGTVAPRT